VEFLKIYIETYGCQMNKSDSERINSHLQSNGFEPALKNKADILIINACSVRQSAIDRVWGQIQKNTKALKHLNTKTLIILTGCILPDDRKKFENKVDLILNIKNLPKR